MSKGNTKILYIVAIVVLYLLGWYTLVNNGIKDSQEYNGYLDVAREKRELKLYEDANDYYKAALGKVDSIELREEMMEFYLEGGYKDVYASFCEQTIEKYPYEALGYEGLAEYYKNNESYYSCFSVIGNAQNRGVTSNKLDSVVSKLAYEYEITYLAFEEVGIFSSGYCAVKKDNGYWGYINPYGTTKIAFKFIDANIYTADGVASIQNQDGTFALIDTTGRTKVVDADKRNIEDCTNYIDGKIAVKYDGKYHYCDINLKELFGEYDYASAFGCGVAAVMNDGAWYIINANGEKVINEAFEDIKVDDKGIAFRNNVAFAKVNGKYILIDVNGKQVGTEMWDDVDAFNMNQPAAVKKGELWGFIDSTGKIVADYQYESAKSFSNGLAAIQKEEVWGYISLDDYQEKIECKFEEANDFSDGGSAFIKNNGKWVLIKIYRLSRAK